MVRSEGNMSQKNPVTPPGIDPGTVRLLAQRLNHYATPGVLQRNFLNAFINRNKIYEVHARNIFDGGFVVL